MTSFAERVTVLCFAASYACALGLELWYVFRPRPILRWMELGFGVAGVFAHSIFVIVQPLSLVSPFGSLLFLAWILAAFYLYGSLHHQRLTWGLFVLPLVLGLVILAALHPTVWEPLTANESLWNLFGFQGENAWGLIHGGLVLLSAVGVCVGFVASLMYFVQVHRLRRKSVPGQGVKMWSLERIEKMNRRAILWAFPMLSAGLLVGIVMQLSRGTFLDGWSSPKILSALGLWVCFGILLYLRYTMHARGRQLALWTMVAFALLVLALAAPVHPFVAEVQR